VGAVRPRERVGSKETNINTTLAELHNEKGEGKLPLVIKNKQEGGLSTCRGALGDLMQPGCISYLYPIKARVFQDSSPTLTRKRYRGEKIFQPTRGHTEHFRQVGSGEKEITCIDAQVAPP